jgi:hypothetical protein
MSDLQKQYEKETGKKTFYENKQGVCYTTPEYVHWLENNLNETQEDLGKAFDVISEIIDTGTHINDYDLYVKALRTLGIDYPG